MVTPAVGYTVLRYGYAVHHLRSVRSHHTCLVPVHCGYTCRFTRIAFYHTACHRTFYGWLPHRCVYTAVTAYTLPPFTPSAAAVTHALPLPHTPHTRRLVIWLRFTTPPHGWVRLLPRARVPLPVRCGCGCRSGFTYVRRILHTPRTIPYLLPGSFPTLPTTPHRLVIVPHLYGSTFDALHLTRLLHGCPAVLYRPAPGYTRGSLPFAVVYTCVYAVATFYIHACCGSHCYAYGWLHVYAGWLPLHCRCYTLWLPFTHTARLRGYGLRWVAHTATVHLPLPRTGSVLVLLHLLPRLFSSLYLPHRAFCGSTATADFAPFCCYTAHVYSYLLRLRCHAVYAQLVCLPCIRHALRILRTLRTAVLRTTFTPPYAVVHTFYLPICCGSWITAVTATGCRTHAHTTAVCATAYHCTVYTLPGSLRTAYNVTAGLLLGSVVRTYLVTFAHYLPYTARVVILPHVYRTHGLLHARYTPYTVWFAVARTFVTAFIFATVYCAVYTTVLPPLPYAHYLWFPVHRSTHRTPCGYAAGYCVRYYHVHVLVRSTHTVHITFCILVWIHVVAACRLPFARSQLTLQFYACDAILCRIHVAVRRYHTTHTPHCAPRISAFALHCVHVRFPAFICPAVLACGYGSQFTGLPSYTRFRCVLRLRLRFVAGLRLRLRFTTVAALRLVAHTDCAHTWLVTLPLHAVLLRLCRMDCGYRLRAFAVYAFCRSHTLRSQFTFGYGWLPHVLHHHRLLPVVDCCCPDTDTRFPHTARLRLRLVTHTHTTHGYVLPFTTVYRFTRSTVTRSVTVTFTVYARLHYVHVTDAVTRLHGWLDYIRFRLPTRLRLDCVGFYRTFTYVVPLHTFCRLRSVTCGCRSVTGYRAAVTLVRVWLHTQFTGYGCVWLRLLRVTLPLRYHHRLRSRLVTFGYGYRCGCGLPVVAFRTGYGCLPRLVTTSRGSSGLVLPDLQFCYTHLLPHVWITAHSTLQFFTVCYHATLTVALLRSPAVTGCLLRSWLPHRFTPPATLGSVQLLRLPHLGCLRLPPAAHIHTHWLLRLHTTPLPVPFIRSGSWLRFPVLCRFSSPVPFTLRLVRLPACDFYLLPYRWLHVYGLHGSHGFWLRVAVMRFTFTGFTLRSGLPLRTLPPFAALPHVRCHTAHFGFIYVCTRLVWLVYVTHTAVHWRCRHTFGHCLPRDARLRTHFCGYWLHCYVHTVTRTGLHRYRGYQFFTVRSGSHGCLRLRLPHTHILPRLRLVTLLPVVYLRLYTFGWFTRVCGCLHTTRVYTFIRLRLGCLRIYCPTVAMRSATTLLRTPVVHHTFARSSGYVYTAHVAVYRLLHTVVHHYCWFYRSPFPNAVAVRLQFYGWFPAVWFVVPHGLRSSLPLLRWLVCYAFVRSWLHATTARVWLRVRLVAFTCVYYRFILFTVRYVTLRFSRFACVTFTTHALPRFCTFPHALLPYLVVHILPFLRLVWITSAVGSFTVVTTRCRTRTRLPVPRSARSYHTCRCLRLRTFGCTTRCRLRSFTAVTVYGYLRFVLATLQHCLRLRLHTRCAHAVRLYVPVTFHGCSSICGSRSSDSRLCLPRCLVRTATRCSAFAHGSIPTVAGCYRGCYCPVYGWVLTRLVGWLHSFACTSRTGYYLCCYTRFHLRVYLCHLPHARTFSYGCYTFAVTTRFSSGLVVYVRCAPTLHWFCRLLPHAAHTAFATYGYTPRVTHLVIRTRLPLFAYRLPVTTYTHLDSSHTGLLVCYLRHLRWFTTDSPRSTCRLYTRLARLLRVTFTYVWLFTLRSTHTFTLPFVTVVVHVATRCRAFGWLLVARLPFGLHAFTGSAFYLRFPVYVTFLQFCGYGSRYGLLPAGWFAAILVTCVGLYVPVTAFCRCRCTVRLLRLRFTLPATLRLRARTRVPFTVYQFCRLHTCGLRLWILRLQFWILTFYLPGCYRTHAALHIRSAAHTGCTVHLPVWLRLRGWLYTRLFCRCRCGCLRSYARYVAVFVPLVAVYAHFTLVYGYRSVLCVAVTVTVLVLPAFCTGLLGSFLRFTRAGFLLPRFFCTFPPLRSAVTFCLPRCLLLVLPAFTGYHVCRCAHTRLRLLPLPFALHYWITVHRLLPVIPPHTTTHHTHVRAYPPYTYHTFTTHTRYHALRCAFTVRWLVCYARAPALLFLHSFFTTPFAARLHLPAYAHVHTLYAHLAARFYALRLLPFTTTTPAFAVPRSLVCLRTTARAVYITVLVYTRALPRGLPAVVTPSSGWFCRVRSLPRFTFTVLIPLVVYIPYIQFWITYRWFAPRARRTHALYTFYTFLPHHTLHTRHRSFVTPTRLPLVVALPPTLLLCRGLHLYVAVLHAVAHRTTRLRVGSLPLPLHRHITYLPVTVLFCVVVTCGWVLAVTAAFWLYRTAPAGSVLLDCCRLPSRFAWILPLLPVYAVVACYLRLLRLPQFTATPLLRLPPPRLPVTFTRYYRTPITLRFCPVGLPRTVVAFLRLGSGWLPYTILRFIYPCRSVGLHDTLRGYGSTVAHRLTFSLPVAVHTHLRGFGYLRFALHTTRAHRVLYHGSTVYTLRFCTGSVTGWLRSSVCVYRCSLRARGSATHVPGYAYVYARAHRTCILLLPYGCHACGCLWLRSFTWFGYHVRSSRFVLLRFWLPVTVLYLHLWLHCLPLHRATLVAVIHAVYPLPFTYYAVAHVTFTVNTTCGSGCLPRTAHVTLLPTTLRLPLPLLPLFGSFVPRYTVTRLHLCYLYTGYGSYGSGSTRSCVGLHAPALRLLPAVCVYAFVYAIRGLQVYRFPLPVYAYAHHTATTTHTRAVTFTVPVTRFIHGYCCPVVTRLPAHVCLRFTHFTRTRFAVYRLPYTAHTDSFWMPFGLRSAVGYVLAFTRLHRFVRYGWIACRFRLDAFTRYCGLPRTTPFTPLPHHAFAYTVCRIGFWTV